MSLAVVAPPSPYKGLAPFEDSDLDALLFFGRERESEVIAANLIAARVTVLYGPSGVGKSSVLRAGVAHRLRQEQEAEVIVFSTWTGDPVAALVEAAGGSGGSLVDALADAADRAGGDLYLILDQFEECFLYHKQGGAFAAELAQVLRRGGLRVNVLIGIREDALARLDALKASIPNLLANRLRLERLDRLAGTAAILGPIRSYNELVSPDEEVAVEPELEQAILDEVTAGRVELSGAGRGMPLAAREENRIEAPYLQLVLARLWEVERERGSHVLQLATLRELGGAEHIVEDHLERAMAELTPREKGAAAAMYHFLVTPSGTKIAHGVRDLAGYAAVEEGEAADVLHRLTAERIVRASSENGPSTTRYEIFHDVLADAVVAWRTRYEADRALAEQREYHHRRQRRLLGIFAVALVAFAVMAAVAVYALAQRSEARHQAAVAKTQQLKAVEAAAVASRARAREAKAADSARASARTARRALHVAEVNEQAAKNAAAAERRAREGESREAERARAAESRANQSAVNAVAQAHVARQATKKALVAEKRVIQQRNVVRAEKLEAQARVLLTEDVEASVRRSLAAIRAFRIARIAPPVGVEDTLREGLVLLRLRAVLRGRGPVNVVRFSPDGSLVFVGGRGGARLYNLKNGYAVRRLLPASDIADAAFSPDGTRVVGAGAGKDRVAHVWDVRSGAELFGLEHEGPVLSVAFSPDGRLIATGSADGTARLWSAAGGLPDGAPFVHQRGARGDDVQQVSFSPDGSRLLTVGGNRFARVFDVNRHVEVFPDGLNNVALVNSARFSHDGSLIATAGASEFVRLWDAKSGAPIAVLEGTGRVTDLAFSPNDKLLATAGGNDTIARVWDVAKQASVAILTVHRSGVESVLFTPDGASVITTGRDGKAYIAGATAGFTQASLAGHHGPVTGATISSDGSLIATWSQDGSARLWDARVGAFGGLPPADAREIGKHDLPAPVRSAPLVAFSPDGRRMLSAGSDGTARIWGPGARIEVLTHNGPVNSASFSRNGKLVITGSDDGTARVWRVSDGHMVASLSHGAPVEVARLTPDGRLAVTAGRDGWTRVWTVAGRTVRRSYQQGGAINDAELSRDGRFVVTAAADGTAAIFGVTSDSTRVLRGHSDEVVAAVFSRDGKRVATASADSTARIWNVRTGDSVVLEGHTGPLTALAFNRDGSRLATGSSDTDIRIWDGRSGKEITVLRVHTGSVNDLAFSADGRWLASAGPSAAGIWETRRRGPWPALPLYLVRGGAPPRLDHVAFSPRGWRLLTGWRSGAVRLYNCRLCGRIPQLSAIARGRLGEIVKR
jgi:WD40 repeat protein